MRFRQRRLHRVLIYDTDSTEATEASSSATAAFGVLIQEDRRATKPVALVTGGLHAMLEKYPFLVKLKSLAPAHGEGVASGTIDDAPPTIFSDDEYPSEILDDFLFLGTCYTDPCNRATPTRATVLHRPVQPCTVRCAPCNA